MNPAVDGQQRRVVNGLVRRNLQGWGRPLDFTVQRLRMGALFSGLGVVFFVLRQLVIQTGSAFLITVFSFLVLLSFAFGLSFLLTHVVPFLRARAQAATPISGKIEAVICDPQDYSLVARGDYHFITLRIPNGPLRAFAIEATQHDTICARRGERVTLDVIPGIERVVCIH